MKTFVTGFAAFLLVLSVALPGQTKDQGRNHAKNKHSQKKDCCEKNATKDCSKNGGQDCCKQEGKMSKVTSFSFHQSGGFMGVDKSYEVKLADLDKKYANELEKLIEKSGLLEVSKDERITKGAADMFIYQFSATENGAVHSLTLDDGTMTDPYRTLFALFKDKLVDNRQRHN